MISEIAKGFRSLATAKRNERFPTLVLVCITVHRSSGIDGQAENTASPCAGSNFKIVYEMHRRSMMEILPTGIPEPRVLVQDGERRKVH